MSIFCSSFYFACYFGESGTTHFVNIREIVYVTSWHLCPARIQKSIYFSGVLSLESSYDTFKKIHLNTFRTDGYIEAENKNDLSRRLLKLDFIRLRRSYAPFQKRPVMKDKCSLPPSHCNQSIFMNF